MKPNILFLVVDSLRSDKFYGESKTSITPNLDSLLENGVYFSQAISSVPSTSPSMGSIFTGLFPIKIGMGPESYEKLNPNVSTFIEHFKKNGYSTFATTSEINSFLGLTEDFDLTLQQTSHNNYFSLFSGLGEKITEKLRTMKKEPWFFYIHINDLHQPVIVPEKYSEEKFGITDYEKMLSAIDFWIGKFFEQIDFSKTLVVLTADHGEYVRSLQIDGKMINLESSSSEKTLWKLGNKIPNFLYGPKRKLSSILQKTRDKNRQKKIEELDLSEYEKRVLSMSRMSSGSHVFDDVLKVPLVFKGFPIKNPKLISQQVGLLDIFPTITDLIEIPKINAKIDGNSLYPLIQNEKIDEKPLFIQSMPSISDDNLILVGIRTNSFKYFREKNNKKKNKLFDLANDPLEEKDISSQKPEIVLKMEKILQEYLITENNFSPDSLQNDERKKVEDELKKLGYL